MRFAFQWQKLLGAGVLCAFALWLNACTETPEVPVAAPDMSELFEDEIDAEIDVESHLIVLPEGLNSFTVDNIAALGGSKCYIALDDDPVDPEIDWDSPVNTGTEIELGDEDLRLVVLDDESRVVAVWTIRLPEKKSSSSVKAKSSSSSEKSSSSAKSPSAGSPSIKRCSLEGAGGHAEVVVATILPVDVEQH